VDTVTIEKQQFDEMLGRLERIASLLALNLVKDCKIQKDKILMLSSFGYGATDISKLLNTTVGTVNVALTRERRKSAKSAVPAHEPIEGKENETKEETEIREPK
jgi:DNA-directed RNA polymerase specialized sigma24 family protein